ncbi:guanylate kinase [Parvularcula sp. ZS-1/3]|uniref:Guanylate kinase n=1 Tax=Parvularcula mediterranea TaxID=2732508 RepID=A0A7Y3RJL9_9PROT|nr:guanylate kinase [Parvularcula mediterranea]NNU15190.1 guanylate kinase [Parvularcula mediterranea]
MPNPVSIQRRGLLLVLSSPSGAGKTTLSKRLLGTDAEIELSVSATTRPMRPGEIDGKDYHFTDLEKFEAMDEEGLFLESATVFGNKYGTPKEAVFNTLEEGRDILFDIDWQGKQQLDERAGGDVVSVFILPPSRDTLEDRLRRRKQDSDDVIAKRMEQADEEIGHYAEYDYVILNDDIDKADTQLRAILQAERLKRRRQTGLREFVDHVISPRD